MENLPESLKAATRDYLLAERQRRRTGVARTIWLMKQCGMQPCVSPNIVEAIFPLIDSDEPRQQLLNESRNALRSRMVLLPKGLECLPSCWVKALPGIWSHLCQMNPRWAGTALSAVAYEHGVLRLASAQEQNIRLNQVSVYDQMRIEINSRLYPSIWRPLKRCHELAIWKYHPELRKDLFMLPDSEGAVIAQPKV